MGEYENYPEGQENGPEGASMSDREVSERKNATQLFCMIEAKSKERTAPAFADER